MLDDATTRSPPAPDRGQRVLGPRAIAALGTGLIVLLAVVAASMWLAVRNRDTLLVTARTDRARIAVADVLNAASDAETGQRGYLLTGREDYLAPYTRAAAALPGEIAALRRELSTDADAAPLLGRLDAVVAEKMAELAQTLALARAGDKAGALAVVQSDTGKRAMDSIRALTNELQSRQQALVVRQLDAVNGSGQLLVAIDVVGLVLVLVLGGGVIVATSRTLASVRRAEADLTRAYARLEVARDTLEERVRLRTAELTESNAEIQRFAYIVSHDLRAPLVNILGFTSELEAATNRLAAHVATAADNAPADVLAAAREDVPEAIRFIRTSAQKMDRLIGAILKLSREGGRVMAPETLAMRPLLEGIVASLAHQAAERGATITVEPVPDFVADRLMVEQIFSNLVENALKYLKAGRPGRVRVRGQLMGDVALFEVADNGRGIAARDLERIFELFRRAGDQDVPGEGIGLAHVRALVRRLGGKIDCDSTVDVGSTFRVQVPTRPGPSKGLQG